MAPSDLIACLTSALKREMGGDEKRIAHAQTVLSWAQQLLAAESGDPVVVIAAALLHDIGIPEAERKHGSAAGCYQEVEGPPIARRMLRELGLDDAVVDHVCEIVANHHSARNIATSEFNIIWDSDWLVNLPDEHPGRGREELGELIERIFRTETGKATARRVYLESGPGE